LDRLSCSTCDCNDDEHAVFECSNHAEMQAVLLLPGQRHMTDLPLSCKQYVLHLE